MDSPAPTSPKRRLFLVLAGITLATLAAVGLLLFRQRPTVVELTLHLEGASFTVLPAFQASQAGTEAAPLSAVPLLAPALAVRGLELRGGDRVEAQVEGGKVVLWPGREGRIAFTAPEPFAPDLTAYGPACLRVEPAGRDRSGAPHAQLTITPLGPAGRWVGRLPAGAGLSLRTHDAEEADAADAAHAADATPGARHRLAATTREVPADAPDPALFGATAEAHLALTLPAAPAPSTVLRVVDPASGEVSVARHLAFASTQPRSLLWGDRVVLLDPEAGGTSALPLLQPDLKVERVELYRWVKLEEESDVRGGTVRFPGGEREPVELPPRSILTLRAERPLTLRALTLGDGELEMVLWGKAASLEVGPTSDLQAQLLPSELLWLYTHRSTTILYTTLVTVLGGSLALFRTFGLLKS
ncbi:MAG TPA: hypothetical protein VFE33_08175 [Thermoanaerobaculia bacterium]|nr:hypothetical protein [Thermoanaerobaculia bacterium]